MEHLENDFFIKDKLYLIAQVPPSFQGYKPHVGEIYCCEALDYDANSILIGLSFLSLTNDTRFTIVPQEYKTKDLLEICFISDKDTFIYKLAKNAVMVSRVLGVYREGLICRVLLALRFPNEYNKRFPEHQLDLEKITCNEENYLKALLAQLSDIGMIFQITDNDDFQNSLLRLKNYLSKWWFEDLLQCNSFEEVSERLLERHDYFLLSLSSYKINQGLIIIYAPLFWSMMGNISVDFRKYFKICLKNPYPIHELSSQAVAYKLSTLFKKNVSYIELKTLLDNLCQDKQVIPFNAEEKNNGIFWDSLLAMIQKRVEDFEGVKILENFLDYIINENFCTEEDAADEPNLNSYLKKIGDYLVKSDYRLIAFSRAFEAEQYLSLIAVSDYIKLKGYFINSNYQIVRYDSLWDKAFESYQEGDASRSTDLYEKLLNENEPYNFEIGLYFANGRDDNTYWIKSLYYHLQALNEGEIGAAYSLGYLYQSKAHTFPLDEKESHEYFFSFRKASLFHMQAFAGFRRYPMSNLLEYNAMLYEFGYTVAKEPNMAFLLAFQGVINLQNYSSRSLYKRLAFYYLEGFGTEVNLVQAAKFSRLAADEGEVDCMVDLGFNYLSGKGVEKDYDQALELFTQVLENSDDWRAWLGVARIYADPDYTRLDPIKSIEAYERTIAINPEFSLVEFATHLMDERYGFKDLEKAIPLFERAATEFENVDAMYQLGLTYQEGLGVKKDIKEAIKWFTKAAKHGLVGAESALGKIHLNGIGVPIDIKKAISWYKKAAAQDEPEALYVLGKFYYESSKEEQDLGLEYLTKAAAEGSDKAQLQLGEMFEKGIYFGIDMDEALSWFNLSAEYGNNQAMMKLYHHHLNQKENKDINIKLAEKWLNKAAQAGNEEAVNILKKKQGFWNRFF